MISSSMIFQRFKVLFADTNFFSTVFGALSIVLLVQDSIQVGIHAAFQRVLDYYQWALDLLFAWTEPYILALFESFTAFIQLPLELNSSWKNVFVIIMLFVVRGAQVDYNRGQKAAAIATILIGVTTTLISSMLASTFIGSVGPQSIAGAIIPVAGLITFEMLHALVKSGMRRDYYGEEFGKPPHTFLNTYWFNVRTFALPIAISGAAASSTAFSARYVFPDIVTSASIFAVLLFIVFYASYLVFRGVRLAYKDRKGTETWEQRFFRSGSSKVSLLIFQALFGAIGFLLIGAGVFGK